MNAMETAPHDRPILIFARWDWAALHGDDCDEEFFWAVAEWRDSAHKDESGFWSITANPYSDRAVDPQGWAELPT